MRKLFNFSLHKGKLNEETISNFQAFMNSKKNSCRGNYMRKYGTGTPLIGRFLGPRKNCLNSHFS